MKTKSPEKPPNYSISILAEIDSEIDTLTDIIYSALERNQVPISQFDQNHALPEKIHLENERNKYCALPENVRQILLIINSATRRPICQKFLIDHCQNQMYEFTQALIFHDKSV